MSIADTRNACVPILAELCYLFVGGIISLCKQYAVWRTSILKEVTVVRVSVYQVTDNAYKVFQVLNTISVVLQSCKGIAYSEAHFPRIELLPYHSFIHLTIAGIYSVNHLICMSVGVVIVTIDYPYCFCIDCDKRVRF